MKANELRIGNYVLCIPDETDEKSLIGQVVALDSVDLTEHQIWIIEDSKEEHDFYDLITGIPLTEQWLKDFGFVKRNNVAWDYKEKLSNTFFPILTINVFSFDMITDDKYGTILKYVHSLQNLYFALTGKELTKLNNQ